MEKLKQIIEEQGQVMTSEVLKTDRFLNHAIDPALMDEIGREFARAFQNQKITRVITIESGGIAPALAAAYHLGVPMVFVKKAKPVTMVHPLVATVHSFTKNKDYELCMEKSLILENDRVLFIDDFLANGDALKGIQSLIDQSQATLAGVGICIEKAWQAGRKKLEKMDIPVCILASIASMSEKGIVWNKNDPGNL